MFHVDLKGICILLFLDGTFYKCLLGPFDLKYGSNPKFFVVYFLSDLPTVESGVLKFPTITVLLSVFLFSCANVCLIYLGAPMLGAYTVMVVLSS